MSSANIAQHQVEVSRPCKKSSKVNMVCPPLIVLLCDVCKLLGPQEGKRTIDIRLIDNNNNLGDLVNLCNSQSVKHTLFYAFLLRQAHGRGSEKNNLFFNVKKTFTPLTHTPSHSIVIY